MKRLFVVAVLAALAACAPRAPDLSTMQFQVVAELPESPRIRYRPSGTAAFQARAELSNVRGPVFTGDITIAELAPNRLRITQSLTHVQLPTGLRDSQTAPFTTPIKLGEGGPFSVVEVDASGRYIAIDPTSPQFAKPAAAGGGPRDWPELFELLEGLPVYRADLTLGTPILPTTPAELLDKRVELLEAMVRSNTAGTWADLPRGGTLTPAQREAFAASIRARSMPAVYESDIRIRGSTTVNGRTALYASGLVRMSQPNGTVSSMNAEYLLDPATGLVVYRRSRPAT